MLQHETLNGRTTRASCGGISLIWYCAGCRQRPILLYLFAVSFVSLLIVKQESWQQRSKRVVMSCHRQMPSTFFCRRIRLNSGREN